MHLATETIASRKRQELKNCFYRNKLATDYCISPNPKIQVAFVTWWLFLHQYILGRYWIFISRQTIFTSKDNEIVTPFDYKFQMVSSQCRPLIHRSYHGQQSSGLLTNTCVPPLLPCTIKKTLNTHTRKLTQIFQISIKTIWSSL